ncbi:MSCRAMM family protein [Nocardioides plantarum]|uniref:Collagen binding domain-containing protein n=1 Tax=Nocardioides plantarum TaxID=29299 RepID=A0ABV5K7F7_9ACTN|nr:hypothetical protein [Nocardioides plantarum]
MNHRAPSAGTTSSYAVRLLVGLLLALFVGLSLAATPASAATATGKVRGAIVQSGSSTPRTNVLWFDAGWRYLGTRKADAGGYSLTLKPGKYFLQFVDQRPAYDVTKNAPATVSVTVYTGSTTVRNVRMRRGASIGGKVLAGGKAAAGAKVVAANTSEQSFTTTADGKGNYALGGLPAGKYSVFTYDRKQTWVARSTYLGSVKGSKFRQVDLRLVTRAGNLLLDVYAGKEPARTTASVTAVSVRTGQFWTARVRQGSVTFKGLFPGRYRVQVPGIGNYLPATVSVRTEVRSQRLVFGSARLTKRGGWITGRIVDANHPTVGLSKAVVRLFDKNGKVLDTTTSSASGAYTLDGQLTTQYGLRVVAGPGPYSDYLGPGSGGNSTSYCKYAVTKVAVSLQTGKRTYAGNLLLKHQPDSAQDGEQCRTPAPTPTPTATPTP